jgi:meiotic recombination protein SPO11
MFSVSGAQQQIVNIDGTPQRQHHSVLPEINSEAVQIPPGTQTPAISQIEALLESIVDAVSTGNELVIPYRSIRSSNKGAASQSQHGGDRPLDVVRFPGRTIQEAKRFGTSEERR